MITYLFYLFNWFNPPKTYDRTNYHRRYTYCGNHYMLEYLKKGAFKYEKFNDATKLIPVLEKYTKIQTMYINNVDLTNISKEECIENKDIEHYRSMTHVFWENILQEPKHILPHPHYELKYKQPASKNDDMNEIYEFLTLHWAVDMAKQKCTSSKDELYEKPIYLLMMKEFKDSDDPIKNIKSIENYRDTIWNCLSSESGKF